MRLATLNLYKSIKQVDNLVIIMNLIYDDFGGFYTV